MKKTLLFLLTLLGVQISTQAQVTNGLVAKYSFNNGTADDEVGNNHGTVTNATLTTDRFGNSDMAYSFDGQGDHIDFTDGAEFQMGTHDFSISLWVNYTLAQQGVVFSKRDGATSNYSQYNLSVLANPQFGGISKNMWTFERCSMSDDRSALVGDISGSWKHVVFVHGHLDSTIIYVDGQYVAHDMGVFDGNLNVAGRPLVLGYHSENNASFFNGQIDDIRVYNRKLGESEVITLYNELDPALAMDPKANSNQAITVFPNPTNSLLQISVTQATTIAVVDILGRNHGTFAIESENNLDVSDFESGIYFLRDLNTGKAVKFIKE